MFVSSPFTGYPRQGESTGEKRYRRPGMASKLSPLEVRAIQAFQYFGGYSITELAERFHRHRRTIRKALRDSAFVEICSLEVCWCGSGGLAISWTYRRVNFSTGITVVRALSHSGLDR